MCNKYLVTYLLKRGLSNQNGDGNINGNLKKFDSGLKQTTTIINCLFINIFFNAFRRYLVGNENALHINDVFAAVSVATACC